MTSPDIRWIQRFHNYIRALHTLRQAVRLNELRPLSELEQQGLIQGFEFTHELAWNVMKDYLEEQGFVGVIGSKNATRQAFKNSLIEDGEVWMEMINARNISSHTYDTAVAEKIVNQILHQFFSAFEKMEIRFLSLKDQLS